MITYESNSLLLMLVNNHYMEMDELRGEVKNKLNDELLVD